MVLSQRFEVDLKPAFRIYRAPDREPSPYVPPKMPDATIAGVVSEMRGEDQGREASTVLSREPARGANASKTKRWRRSSSKTKRSANTSCSSISDETIWTLCKYGTVRVETDVHRTLFSRNAPGYSARGELPEGGSLDTMMACSRRDRHPGPKVRGMEIIDVLWKRRDAGLLRAVMYLDFSNNLDSCIAIRRSL